MSSRGQSCEGAQRNPNAGALEDNAACLGERPRRVALDPSQVRYRQFSVG